MGISLFLKYSMKNLKKKVIKGYADEGGYWPCFNKNEDILIFLSKIIKKSGFKLLKEVSIALDVSCQ